MVQIVAGLIEGDGPDGHVCTDFTFGKAFHGNGPFHGLDPHRAISDQISKKYQSEEDK